MYFPKEQVTLIEILGEGGFAKVHRALIGGNECAIKLFLNQTSQNIISKEILNMQTLKHINLLNMTAIDKWVNPRWLATELCQKHDLFSILSTKGYLQRPHAIYLIKEIIQGLEYIHSQGFAHRDIKPENILFSSNLTPKISDFGFTTKIDQEFINRREGSQGYLAPELQIGDTYVEGYELFPTDIFSLGVVIFTIVCGFMPFGYEPYKRNSKMILISRNLWVQYWQQHPAYAQKSEEFQEMVQGMFAFKPQDRWTLQTLKECAFLNQQTSSPEEFKISMQQIIQTMVV